jgi:integrase
MHRDFYLHTRHNGIYYAELMDPETGRKLSARSTGEKDRDKALLKVAVWRANGLPTGRARKPRPFEAAVGLDAILRSIRKTDLNEDDALRIVDTLKAMGLVDVAAVKPTGRGAVPFVEFLRNFWDYDRSEYIKDRLSHGYHFGRDYAKGCQGRIKAHLDPFFNDKKLNCVTTEDLRTLSNRLAGLGLATATINQVMLTAVTPLKWAYNQKIIPLNPAVGLTRFSVTNKKRGVLTEDEAVEVFSVEWSDKRTFVGNLVSATTGIRAGECAALRRSDIGTNILHIRHSYSAVDKLKTTKTGVARTAPLLSPVREALLDLLDDNPHKVPDPFIFYSPRKDKPMYKGSFLDGLYEAIDKVNAGRREKDPNAEIIDYKSRTIVFHSWRHYFCSRMTDVIDPSKVARVSGHISESVFKKYTDHIERKNIVEVREVAECVFGNLVQAHNGTN